MISNFCLASLKGVYEKEGKKKIRVKLRKTIYFYNVCVWIRMTYMLLAFCIFFFFFSFLFFACVSILEDKIYCSYTVYVLFKGLTTILLKNIYIKNWSHGTVHTFKNYFDIVFSVFHKISCIQIEPKYKLLLNPNSI